MRRKEQLTRQNTLTKIFFSNPKQKLRKEISTGEHQGKYNSRSDLYPSTNTSLTDLTTNMPTTSNTTTTASELTSHEFTNSTQATSASPSNTRGPFNTNSNNTTDRMYFINFNQRNGSTDTQATVESSAISPREVKRVCCGLFDKDDGDYDDTIPSYFELLKNIVHVRFFPFVWPIIGAVFMFLFFISYGFISKRFM